MREYAFRNMILGDVDNVVNSMSRNGFGPENIYKEGSRMYILFSKWIDDDDEIELSELDQCYIAMDQVSSRLNAVEKALQVLGSAPAEVEVPVVAGAEEGQGAPPEAVIAGVE